MKPSGYLAICREERFYCGLLMHALLASATSRLRVCALLAERGHALESESLQVYIEPALLRDAWFALGNHKKWTPELARRRTDLIRAMLGAPLFDLPPMTLKDELPSYMRTSAGKVMTPGRWSLQEIASTPDAERLTLTKWAFNAKPDLLLTDGRHGVLMEAKVESGLGSAPTGYAQQRVLEVIAHVAPQFVASVSDDPLSRVLLAPTQLSPTMTVVTWKEIVRELALEDLGEFAAAGLTRVANW